MDDSWSPVNLGDIYTPGRGISYSANDLKDVDGTGLPFITIKNFNKGGGFNHKGLKTYSGPDFPQHRLVTAALLIANTDVTRDAEIIGAPLLVPKLDDQPLFSMDVNQLTQAGKIGCVDPQYIFFRLCIADARSHMQRVSAGSTVLHLNVKDALKFKFDLPPVQEQTKIAQILGTLDAQIQKTEALITKLEKIKEGLLHDMLTRGIDQNGQLRPTPEQAPEIYKESVLGLIPKEWAVSDLGAISTSSVIGPFGSDLVASDYRSDGVPVVFVRDIAGARYSRVSQVCVSQDKAKVLSAHEVKPGDLLLTKMGLPPCISAVYPESESIGIITADIVRLRLKTAVAPKWAHYYVNAEPVMAQVRGITAGVTRPKVTLKDVRNLKIALPDIEEQDQILSILKHSSRRLESESANLEKLRAQKSGLMDDLLTGRVRVTPLLPSS
jgi:type I restriction enzyme S subunit